MYYGQKKCLKPPTCAAQGRHQSSSKPTEIQRSPSPKTETPYSWHQKQLANWCASPHEKIPEMFQCSRSCALKKSEVSECQRVEFHRCTTIVFKYIYVLCIPDTNNVSIQSFPKSRHCSCVHNSKVSHQCQPRQSEALRGHQRPFGVWTIRLMNLQTRQVRFDVCLQLVIHEYVYYI